MFDYNKAFSRNLGWITESERDLIKNITIATAGCGGVGGEHLVTLSRLGYSNFKISDFDIFEIHNFNRQALAFVSTIDKAKVDVAKDVLKDINPDSNITSFPQGVNEDNVDEFLDGVDIYADSLDINAMDIRILIFKKCRDKNIPIVIAGPLGMGTSFMCFDHKKINIIDYFDFKETDSKQIKVIKFLVALSPKLLHVRSLIDDSYVDIANEKTPSTPIGVKAASAALCSQVLKLSLNRGDAITAPRSMQVDFYSNKSCITKLRRGNKGLIQKLKIAFIKYKYST